MWSYYGSKSKVVDYYPLPKHGLIIEPFAGTARYALKYYDREVLLIDKYEIVVRIWKWLQKCSPNDILSLPKLQAGQKIDREEFDCIEQAWLMGFLIKQGVSTPDLTVSSWGALRLESKKKRIASQLFKIKHWKIDQGEFDSIPNQKATWFIDSPYKYGGKYYRWNNKHLDFDSLATWAKEREGQVIVCENTKADWLPFQPMKVLFGQRKQTTEAIWTNEPTSYNNKQLRLIA